MCVCVSPRRINAGDVANGLYGPGRVRLGHARERVLQADVNRKRIRGTMSQEFPGYSILKIEENGLARLRCKAWCFETEID